MVLVVVILLLDILCFTGQVCNGSRNMAMASGFLEAGRQLVVCSQARSAMVAKIMDSRLMYSVLLDWFGCTWTGERTVKEDLLPFLVELISKISYTRYLK